jgi:DNA invertase Pin-like site-specific DNA recombinase
MSVALVYVRQSRHRDNERTVSPQVQREACLALPAVQDCDQVEVLEDLDASGKSTRGRKGFLTLLERVKAGGVDVVALYDQSRAFRATADALAFYALVEQHPEVNVQLVHGRFDRSPAGEFTYTTLAAAHAMERRMVAEKMRDAVHYRAGRGDMVGTVPAGYLREKKTGTVTIDEPTAATVRRLFADYASGRLSVREIARRLNIEGVLLPGAKAAWRGDTVAQLLGNIAYIGRTYSRSRRRQEGEEILAAWPAIVPRDLWDAVQRQLRLRASTRAGRRPRGEPRQYAFGGLLRCACGRKMHSQADGPRLYYRCPGTDAAEACRHLVREDRLLPWAEDVIRRLDALESDSQLRAGVAELVGAALPQGADAMAQVDATIDRLGKRYEWGHVTDAAYRAEWDRLHEIRSELEGAVRSDPPIPLDGIWQAWQTGDQVTRRELLGLLFDELDVDAGAIVGYKPRQDQAAYVARLMDRLGPDALAIPFAEAAGGGSSGALLHVGPTPSRPTSRTFLLILVLMVFKPSL